MCQLLLVIKLRPVPIRILMTFHMTANELTSIGRLFIFQTKIGTYIKLIISPKQDCIPVGCVPPAR